MSVGINLNNYVPDCCDKIKHLLAKESVQSFNSVTAKVHLVVTVDSQTFAFDSVIDSDRETEPMSLAVLQLFSTGISDISSRVDGVFKEKFSITTDVFLKNNKNRYLWIQSGYKKAKSHQSGDSSISRPLKAGSFVDHVNECKGAFKEKTIPLLDSKGNFLHEEEGGRCE